MHITTSMLQGTICPITATLSAIGLTIAAYSAIKAKRRPSVEYFAAIAALIFAMQMVNFPIQSGTSGHFLGGVLASALLGTSFGVLAMTFVITIQTLIFSDGGLTVLGTNIFNMAILGAGLTGLLKEQFFDASATPSFRNLSGLGFLAWFSVIAAAFASSIELALSGNIAFFKVTTAMLSVHAIIGIAEAILTVALYAILVSNFSHIKQRTAVYAPLFAAIVISLILSPFASGLPDGLEWVATQYQLFHNVAPTFVSPLADYTVSFVNNQWLSSSLAGFVGVSLTFTLVYFAGQLLNWPNRKRV